MRWTFLHSLFFVSSKTVSRVMSRIIIYLILLLPTDFSDPPKSVTGSHIAFYSVLLRMGFTYALSVTRKAVVSYTALPPLPAKAGGIFLLHYPWSRLHRTLSGILPCEARTFLTWPLSVLPAAIIHLTEHKRHFNTGFPVCKYFLHVKASASDKFPKK